MQYTLKFDLYTCNYCVDDASFDSSQKPSMTRRHHHFSIDMAQATLQVTSWCENVGIQAQVCAHAVTMPHSSRHWDSLVKLLSEATRDIPKSQICTALPFSKYSEICGLSDSLLWSGMRTQTGLNKLKQWQVPMAN